MSAVPPAIKTGLRLRRRVQTRVVVGNVVAGQLIALYFDSRNSLPAGQTPTHYWLLCVAGSAALGLVFVLTGRPLATRVLSPALRWLDEDRGPTTEERVRVLAVPRLAARVVAVAWLATAVVITVANIVQRSSPRTALSGPVVILLGGATASALSFLLVEASLRPVIGTALAGEVPASPAGGGIRVRLMLAWVLGSGIPLLGIAMTPLIREHDALLPLAAPVVVLALGGFVTGAAITNITARSLADPMDSVRAALRRVEAGDIETSVVVDDAGEVGLVQAGFNRMVAGLRERQRLQDLFGRHVGPEVARRALDSGVVLGGEYREVTALFVDIIGSSALARERPAAEVVDVLNRFFGVVVDAVTAEGGWVNKFDGDGALCVFGAPGVQPDHAASALRAARAMQRAVPIDAGIGVATGAVVAGNVGTEARYEYTVIGTPVNEAARLTEKAKHTSARVLASAAAVAAAGREEAQWRPAGTADLRGIGEVETYEPVASAAPSRSPARASRSGSLPHK